MKHSIWLLTVGLVAGCGPSYAPANAPSRPCPEIDETAFDVALAAGAARGDATVYPSGTVDLRFGPGVAHCATFNSAIRPCRRPNDLVIRYTFEDGSQTRFVRVEAGRQYRFHTNARPTTCQIVNEHAPGS